MGLQHHERGLQSNFEGHTIGKVTATEVDSFLRENRTVHKNEIQQFWDRRRLQIEGQYAYLCIAFLVCLTLACLWYMRGFHCRHKSKVNFSDKSHLLTVKEVLFRKARYLPMFNRNDGLVEVFVRDCGTDP